MSFETRAGTCGPGPDPGPRLDGQCRCPTCGAIQPWQDECRRCRTELVVLRRIAEETVRVRYCLLEALKENEQKIAGRLAERLVDLSPTPFHRALLKFSKNRI